MFRRPERSRRAEQEVAVKKTCWLGAALVMSGSTLFGMSAHAEPIKPERDFKCVVGGATADTGVTLSLDVPGSAKPGDTLNLAGTLQLSFPDEVKVASQLVLATKAGISSTTFSLTAVVGGKHYKIKPSEVTLVEQKFSSPFLVSADIKFAEFTVPSSAQGNVILQMPSEPDALNPVGPEPERVAFGAVIAQDSMIVKTRDVDCWVPDGEVLEPVARIPVSSSGKAASGAVGETPVSTSTPLVPADGGSLPGIGELPASLPVDAGDAAAGTPVNAPVVTAPVSASIPPATARSGTFIANWALIVMVAFLPAVLLGYAVRQRLLLSALVAQAKQE